MTLFGKAVELLGGTFLGEVEQERWALRVSRLLPLLVHSSLPNCSRNGINQAPTPATVTSPPLWTMSLQTASQTSSLKLSLVRCFVTRMRTDAKAIRESDFFLRSGRIKSERGGRKEESKPGSHVGHGILGDLSYGGNKNKK